MGLSVQQAREGQARRAELSEDDIFTSLRYLCICAYSKEIYTTAEEFRVKLELSK